jgi:hypothetical protein
MNATVQTILEILKYTIPAIVVLIACAIIVKRFLVTEVKERQLALLQDNQDTTVRLRLQAYERLVLFIERIHPRALVPRVYQTGMNVAELHAVLMYTIKSEFEHNLTQQIYVTTPVWKTVMTVKEQELNMINTIAKQLNPEAPAKELHSRLLDYLLTVDELPSEIALNMINEEARRVLSYGSQA